MEYELFTGKVYFALKDTCPSPSFSERNWFEHCWNRDRLITFSDTSIETGKQRRTVLTQTRGTWWHAWILNNSQHTPKKGTTLINQCGTAYSTSGMLAVVATQARSTPANFILHRLNGIDRRRPTSSSKLTNQLTSSAPRSPPPPPVLTVSRVWRRKAEDGRCSIRGRRRRRGGVGPAAELIHVRHKKCRHRAEHRSEEPNADVAAGRGGSAAADADAGLGGLALRRQIAREIAGGRWKLGHGRLSSRGRTEEDDQGFKAGRHGETARGDLGYTLPLWALSRKQFQPTTIIPRARPTNKSQPSAPAFERAGSPSGPRAGALQSSGASSVFTEDSPFFFPLFLVLFFFLFCRFLFFFLFFIIMFFLCFMLFVSFLEILF